MRTVLILFLLAAGCGGATTGGDGPVVLATTSILGDVVGNVAGTEAQVEVLMPPGVDPHEFEPSAQQAALLREADLVVANGLGLEESFADTLDAVERESGNVLEVAPEVDPLPYAEGGGHEEEAPGEHEGEAGALDPHVWQDPVRMASAARLIATRLGRIAPGGWSARADAYAGELEALDREIRATLADIPPEGRELVTNHEAFGYLAARYDLEVIGVVIPGGSTLAEPTPEELADLAAVLREHDAAAIFTESIGDPGLAETIAEEAGRPVAIVPLYSDSLGEPGSGADTYIGMLRTNARRIAEALS